MLSLDDFQVDEGLRGGFCRMHWDSGLMQCAFSAPTLQGLVTAFDPIAPTPSTGESTTRREVFQNIPRETKNLHSRFRHEGDHLRRHFSTSYGYFVHFLESQLPSLFARMFEASSDLQRQLPFPLIDPEVLDQIRLVAAAHALGEASPFSEPFPNQAAVFLMANGTVQALVDIQPAHAFAISRVFLRSLSDSWCEQHPEAVPFSLRWGPESELVGSGARATLGQDELVLSPRHILEFLGILCEWNAAMEVAEVQAEAFDLMQGEEYNAVWRLWGGLFPHASLWDSETPETLEKDRFLFMYRAFPLELHAALDLALWIPFSPQGFLSSKERIFWDDLSPACRFLRICSYFHENHVQFQPLGGEDRNARFEAIQETLCSHFGWPTPRALADRWLAFLVARFQATKHGDFFFLDAPSHPRLDTSITYLRSRLDTPCDFSINNVGAIPSARPLGYIFRDNEDRYVIRGTDSDEAGLVAPTPAMVRLLISGARFFGLGDRFGRNDLPLYAQDHLQQVIELFSVFLREEWLEDFQRMSRECLGCE